LGGGGGGVGGGLVGASARTHHVRADACARPRVNADAGGRPDDVHGHPDEKDV
jgi:hypothetical protein